MTRLRIESNCEPPRYAEPHRLLAQHDGWLYVETDQGERVFVPPNAETELADCPLTELLSAAKEADDGKKQ